MIFGGDSFATRIKEIDPKTQYYEDEELAEKQNKKHKKHGQKEHRKNKKSKKNLKSSFSPAFSPKINNNHGSH